ncbi:hypothetical protein ABXS69_05990 [Actinomyces timonensis]|uniref:Uncharacterized protein n=1 Tax=Actinomyces timonensis TaxID=1288391 RepID=A0AAU8N2H6_9ACTO
MPADALVRDLKQAAARQQREHDQQHRRQWGQAIAWHKLTWSTPTANVINI